MPLLAHIKSQAKEQLHSAAAWYREQEPDQLLWLELLDEFDEVLGLICDSAEMFIEWEGSVRRAVLKRFPYAIYYQVESDRIVVLQFLPMAQERGSTPPGHAR